jgi:hypothetical protein
MKEATGELNMTVITLVAVAAIAAIFYFVLWPLVQQQLVSQTCRTTYGPDYVAVKQGNNTYNQGTSQATVRKWKCCKGNTSASNCYNID